jgi:hypothetical protein
MNGMLPLIWGMLNIVIYGYFIFLTFKAAKFVRERIGALASVIFVVTLFSITIYANNNNVGSTPGRKWQFSPADNSEKSGANFVVIGLEKTIASSYNLGVSYQITEKTHTNIPINAWSFQTGFVSGSIWKPTSITVNPAPASNKLAYSVDGINEWKLLGITLYAQSKHYAGTASIKQPGHI